MVHRNFYVMITQCIKHVGYKIPNELNYMNFLLDDIGCKDPGLNAVIAMVKCDKVPTGKMNKLKYAAAYLTPCYPVAKNRNTNRKRGAAEISNASGRVVQVSETG